VSEETYTSWFRAHPEPGDLIFVTKGSPGQVCLAPDPVDFCIAQDMVALRANKQLVYPPFLFALLRSSEIQDKIANMHVGTLIPHFKKGDFDKLSLNIPEEPEQLFIGDFYLRISERIDGLSKTNDLLESMARGIFKSWFVDFDPVRAKAEGREPEGIDADTAANFPSEFQQSELGEIPFGWTVNAIADVAKSNRNTIGKGYAQGEIEYVDISSVEPGRIANSTKFSLSEAPSRARRLVSDGDTIWSCVRPNRRSYALILGPSDNLVVSTGFVTLTPTKIPFSLLYFTVTTSHFVDYLTSRADGAAYPAVRPEVFDGAKVIVPSAAVADKFHELTKPMLRAIEASQRQAKTLAQLRDNLLPRLISGRMRVSEAEKLVEAVL